MMRYSVQPGDQILVKDYGCLSFAKNMSQRIGKIVSKKLSGKYSQKILGHAKQSATDAFKTASKRTIEKTAVATGDFGNKIAKIITKVSKNSQQINSERVLMNENDK